MNHHKGKYGAKHVTVYQHPAVVYKGELKQFAGSPLNTLLSSPLEVTNQ